MKFFIDTANVAEIKEAAAMGEEGRRRAKEVFDEEAVFDRVKQTYSLLLRRRGMTPPVPPAGQ